MAPRTAPAPLEPYVVEGVASPAETRKLFGIDDERAEQIATWLQEAFVEANVPRGPVAAKKAATRRLGPAKAKKRSAKR